MKSTKPGPLAAEELQNDELQEEEEQESGLYGGFWTDYTIKMLIEGITPLMTNNPAGMLGKGGPWRSGKNIPTPAEAAEGSTYRRDDGGLGFPAAGVRKCLITGATGASIGTRAASSVLSESISHFPPLEGDELFPLEDLEGQALTNYEIDTRRGIRGKEGVPISRARVFPWRLRCQLKLTVPAEQDMETFKNGFFKVANKAGQYPGLGDGRPEKIKGKGLWFGKFKVVDLAISPLQ